MRMFLPTAVRLVALAGGCAAGAPALGVNLVVNRDFEDRTLAGINSDYLHAPQGNTVEGLWWANPWTPGGA